jgi:hypothetical protein
MPGKKTKVNLQGTSGPEVEGTEVQILESTERWSEFSLDDGTILRVKMTLLSAVRVDGMYDPEGNPQYVINMAPIISVKSSPEELRKRES